MAFLSFDRSCERLRVLPSIAITWPFVRSVTDPIQHLNPKQA
jgi:hypothetical protein